MKNEISATVHYAWNREFFPVPMQGIDVHLGAFDILKAATHAATIPALSISKTPLFSIFRFAVEESFWRFVFDDGVSSLIETN